MTVYVTKCEKSYYGKEWQTKDIRVFKTEEGAKQYLKLVYDHFKEELKSDIDIAATSDDRDAYNIILKNGDLYNFVIQEESTVLENETGIEAVAFSTIERLS